MPDPVETPAPSTVPPAVVPAAPVVAPAPAVAAPPATPATPAVAAPPAPAAPAAVVPPAPVVPEKYDFSALKLPEGVTLDADRIAAVEPLLKEFGVSQENASKLVEATLKFEGERDKANEAKRESDFKEWMKTTVTNYQAALKKEWGAETDAKLAIAQAGMSKVMTPAAKALLDDTGLGSHPDIVKAFYQVGLMSREDTPPTVTTPAAAGKSAAQVLYGGTTPSNH